MLGSIGRFLKNRNGAFAMQFALLAVPLTVCTGLAVDGGRAFLARYELASALDAAALAIASTVDEDADLNVLAHKFVNANFHGEHNGEIDLDIEDVGDEEETVILTGSVQIKTYFMGLMGQDVVNVSAESEVKRGGNNVEVALALDITSSMTMGVDRMTPLKTAATQLINTVISGQQSPFYSRAAIVPWGSAVHVGSLAPTLRGTPTQGGPISAASWRVVGGVNRSISAVHWRNGSGSKQVSAAAWWKPSSNKTISAITKANPAVVTTTANHGYDTDDFIYLSGVNGMTDVSNKIFKITKISNTTFSLRTVAGVNVNSSSYTAYTNSPAAGLARECYNSTCQIQVTTTTDHGFATGDRIHISGIVGMTEINNGVSGTTPPITWGITAGSSNSTFYINDLVGPTIGSTFTGSGSSRQAVECKVANCEIEVTSNNHGFANGDFVVIWGATGFTQANSALSTTYTVGSQATNTFQLAGTFGPTIGGSNHNANTGTVAECSLATCEVSVTTTAPSLSVGNSVAFSGVGGMTTLNNIGYPIRSKSGNTVVLNGAFGPNHTSNWTSGGTAWCAELGCEWFHYTKSGTAPTNNVARQITNCVSERTGANRYTDVAPTVALVAPYYAAGGYNVCGTANRITPLTDNKPALRDAIQDLVVSGSTAGQVGLAWGWYMLSENWGSIWSGYTSAVDDDYDDPVDYFAPGDYDEPQTKKVLVLMTDGEFNTAHCDGVASVNWAVSGSGAELNNCAPNNDTPFNQARAICNAMDDEIIIFTVGFQIDPDGDAAEFLEECASPGGGFFLSEDGDDLEDDFEEIAESISRLRLSR